MPFRSESLASVTVEDVGPCKKLIKISIPDADIQEKLAESYEKLRQSVHVDGFRPGHVPRKLLERRGQRLVEALQKRWPLGMKLSGLVLK